MTVIISLRQRNTSEFLSVPSVYYILKDINTLSIISSEYPMGSRDEWFKVIIRHRMYCTTRNITHVL